MDLKGFDQLEEFLLKKKQRFVDMFLWQLHLDHIVDRRQSLGLHNDVRTCIHSLEGRYRVFEQAKSNIDNYIRICNQCLIPDEYIAWIDKKNIRLCNFIWLFLQNQGFLKDITLHAIRSNSDKHYIIIRALDMLPEKMPLKIELINNINNAWLVGVDYPGWCYDWLDKRNELQCKKAIDFLSKKVSDKSNAYSKPPLVQDGNELSDYYKFLASVDVWIATPTVKQVFCKKITDAARKWKTPEQKRALSRLRKKAKENSHVILKDKRTIKIVRSLQTKMAHETLEETLKYIVNEYVALVETSSVESSETSGRNSKTAQMIELQDVQSNIKQDASEKLDSENNIEENVKSKYKSQSDIFQEALYKLNILE